jgi:TRAP transporter TAXI family solute receptor
VRRARFWIASGALLLAVASLALWWVRTDGGVPREVRIATAASGGLYYRLGASLGAALSERTGARVTVLETQGSIRNHDLLANGEADLAILQLGPMPPVRGVTAVAPLYQDIVHVVARRGSGIRGVPDLAGRRIITGQPDSGMRISAGIVLAHYGIADAGDDASARYFTALAEDPTTAGAIITSGFANPDLAALLARGDLELIAIDQADAIARRHPLFSAYTIPAGLYGGAPSIPATPVATVATPTILAAGPHVTGALVTEALEALYGLPLSPEVPDLMRRQAAAAWDTYPRHPAAVAFYDPYGGLGVLANLFETLAAIKELIFALGAALYVLATWWRSVERREHEAELSEQKERLDGFLEETAAIERAQMHERDPRVLGGYLDAVTEVKLRALAELTGEAVRGDRMFSILLAQCAGVSRTIEAKLANVPSVMRSTA